MFLRKNNHFIPLVLLLWSVQVLGECNDGLVEHKTSDGQGSVCCVPVFVCPIDHEVVVCTVNGETDKCVPCGEGHINSHASSSFDWEEHRCFNKTDQHKKCGGKDIIPIQSTSTLFAEICPLLCECDTSKCFYGSPCACKKSNNCTLADHELNTETGECEKCPANMYRHGDGCGRCQWNATGWSISQPKVTVVAAGADKADGYLALVHTIPTTDNTTSTTDNLSTWISVSETEVPYNIVSPVSKEMTSGSEGSGVNGSQTGSPGNKSSTSDDLTPVVVGLMVVVVIVSFGVAAVLYVRRQHEAGRTGRLVSIYQTVFRRGKPSRQQVPVEDPEQPVPAETSLIQENGGSKPSQAVKPTVQQSEDDESRESMTPDQSSASLIGSGGASVETEETDKKTP